MESSRSSREKSVKNIADEPTPNDGISVRSVMKVEELYSKESYSQVGVTLQRVPFETEVDVLQVNPFEAARGRGETMAMMSELLSPDTEEMIKGATSYRHQDTDEEFLAIPLKRVDSGPHEHRMLERPSTSGVPVRSATHQTLLDEIDDPLVADQEFDTKGAVPDGGLRDKQKAPRKGNTLTRMLKGMRLDKESTDDAAAVGVQNSISKIFQRIKPVGKVVSRENFNKALHRIGDALQKKGDERPPVRPAASATSRLIGENSFKFKPTPKEADRSPANPN